MVGALSRVYPGLLNTRASELQADEGHYSGCLGVGTVGTVQPCMLTGGTELGWEVCREEHLN